MPIECEIASAPGDREQVYRLRYGCYFRKGSITPRADRQFSDRFDDTPNHFSFLVRDTAREPLATVRISVVNPDRGWTESPAGHVFGDHPAYQVLARESFVEASRLCFGPQARRDVLMGLLGNMAALSDLFQSEWLAACPRQEHALIYQRLFGFRAMAEPRRYFGVDFETQLLGIRREELRENVRFIKPMKNAWAEALAGLQVSIGA
ncbi:MAG TPA: GNAT family N-acyltransferase [Bryobacteraceae bacterium]